MARRAIPMLASIGIRWYSALISMPMLLKPIAVAAATVDPEPMNGSRMTPLPRGRAAWTSCRMKS